MAMLQMQRIFIYALKKDRKQILELLQQRGVVEITDTLPEDNIFHKMDVSYARTSFEKNINTSKEAAEIINRFVPEKKSMLASLQGRKEISTEDYAAFKTKYDDTVRTASQIIAKSKAIVELKTEILKLESQREMLVPWTDFDIPLDFTGTRHTKGFIGALPKAWTPEEIYGILADFMPVNVDVISSSKDQTCIFVLCPKAVAEGVYERLRAADFSHPSVSSKKAPAEQIKDINNRIQAAEVEIHMIEEEITALAEFRQDLLFLQDYDRLRSDKYEIIGQLSQSQNIFVLTGYIALKDSKALEEELNKKFTIGMEFEQPSEGEEVPVLLKNNGFASPLEWVVESFSLPGKGEIDPTMMMAVFYYLLFGIIMADVGYGAIMVIACGILLLRHNKTMESFMKNFLTMFFYCGISTVIWGFVFGSFFSDIIDITAVRFFGADNTPIFNAWWFMPINKPMQMLTFSMALGIVHLLTGLVVKAYQLIRQKDYIAIIYDALSWFVLVISCTIVLISMDMIKSILGITLDIPGFLADICGIAAIISSIIIIATNGRESRNPFKRFLKGLYALYGISGYLGDVLSYSRLLALGLAAGVIGSVVNKMAAMASGGPAGPVIYIIIVVVGHALNFAINILGAYVHTNRLQYVEFFGKFYGGGGRSFNPFNMKTKYYKVKESMKNEI